MVKTKTTQRVFIVFETIVSKGPLTLAQLTDDIDLPRSTLHRALQSLEERGWIRARLHDHAYEVTHRFDVVVANARSAQEELELITPVMQAMASETLFVDFGMFIKPGKFVTLDSNDRKIKLNEPHLLSGSLMAQMALRNLPEAASQRHVDAYLDESPLSERNFLKRDIFLQHLHTLPQKNASDLNFLLVRAVEFPNGAWGSLAFRSRIKAEEMSQDEHDTLVNLLESNSF